VRALRAGSGGPDWPRATAVGALLAPLAAGAIVASLALIAASRWSPVWVWVAVLGIGACAVAANAVSMVTVIAVACPGQVPRDSAVVSAGFFAGFAVGPTLAGLLADAAGG